MEDVRDGPGQLRPACAAMEMRFKPTEGHDPGIRQAGKNQGVHGKLRIKLSCGAEVCKEVEVHGF